MFPLIPLVVKEKLLQIMHLNRKKSRKTKNIFHEFDGLTKCKF